MTTKILALSDALGNLVRFRLLAGQRYDTGGVPPLLAGISFDALIADKAFDSNAISGTGSPVPWLTSMRAASRWSSLSIHAAFRRVPSTRRCIGSPARSVLGWAAGLSVST